MSRTLVQQGIFCQIVNHLELFVKCNFLRASFYLFATFPYEIHLSDVSPSLKYVTELGIQTFPVVQQLLSSPCMSQYLKQCPLLPSNHASISDLLMLKEDPRASVDECILHLGVSGNAINQEVLTAARTIFNSINKSQQHQFL